MTQPISGVLSSLDRILLDAATIQRRVAELAAEIEKDYSGKELCVVTLMDGALFFVADLLRSMDLPIQLFTLTVSSYHGGTTSSGRVELAKKLPFDLKARHVLLIDDILDTGLTLATVIQSIREQSHPETLKTAILLSKERPRVSDVTADYIGFEIADEFVVGYGMDYNGHYRNLPCIGILNPSNLPQS